MQSNTFDEILSLEEQFYEDGFQQGLTDGVKAGRIEGRTFGLEKGFEKYVESGRLYGKSLIWANRMQVSETAAGDRELHDTSIPQTTLNGPEQHASSAISLPPLPKNQRLANHIRVLHALSEYESLSTENTEDGVTDFDDRLKRAQGKAKVIERLVGGTKIEKDDAV